MRSDKLLKVAAVALATAVWAPFFLASPASATGADVEDMMRAQRQSCRMTPNEFGCIGFGQNGYDRDLTTSSLSGRTADARSRVEPPAYQQGSGLATGGYARELIPSH